ncbi:piggyBac transposable element-derived protein 4-like [Bicyclus anynana]|uniref:PiggyBac transposable element-derived protein 4-like n=1 Tax=Bicyclus anynana TaxID=110368 RepID=A0ABM3M3J6_BICAN|nr:piggyBac transposable element-derived protein 4-like [Bicyclus anynana]
MMNHTTKQQKDVPMKAKAAASCAAVSEHAADAQNPIKRESITFGCTLCYEDFVQEDAYNEHMIMHLQDAGNNAVCDASQVCEPRAAVSRSCDSLVLQNNDALLNTKLAPQAACRRSTRKQGAHKRETVAQKRAHEQHRVLLPDAPLRKRRTRKQSPEREPCAFLESPLPSTFASAAPARAAVDIVPAAVDIVPAAVDIVPAAVDIVPAAVDIVPAAVDIEPAAVDIVPAEVKIGPAAVDIVPAAVDIVPAEVKIEPAAVDIVPAEVKIEPAAVDIVQATFEIVPIKKEHGSEEFENVVLVPDLASIVEFPTPSTSNNTVRCSDISLDVSQFSEEVADWLLDSNSDDCGDDNDEFAMSVNDRLKEQAAHIDLTPVEENILQADDLESYRILRQLLPDDCTFDWSEEKSTFTARRETFVGTPGPTFDVTDDMTPQDIFHKMFDVDFVDLLVNETNRYAQQKIDYMKVTNKMTAHSRMCRWKPTDRPEIISFLALMILQGLYPLATEESYFKFNGYGTMPYIAKIMTYNRFLLLKSMLHFVDNETLTDKNTNSKLFKIQPIIDYLNNKFSSLYYPCQEIAIDESLLKWHGRLSFAQKIRSKADHVGVRTYELCESSSGYLWRFRVYTGKNATRDDNDHDNRTEQTDTDDFKPQNATAKIVFDLIGPLLYQGHTVIMDNFYNSPLLARCLKRRQTDCFGTQRLNREFVPNSLKSLTKADLRCGEVAASYCPDIMLMVMRDANIFSMISTYHELEIGTHNKHNKTNYKPSLVLDYNKHMGGVDRKDQYMSSQRLERVRSRIWYKKLFGRLFNTAIFNCFVIYKTRHNLRHRQFRTILAESLLKTYRQLDLTKETRLITRTTGQNTVTFRQSTCTPKLSDRPIVDHDHFPAFTPTKRRRCWWCSHKRQKDSRTAYRCQECNINLCIVGCFRDYHKP